MESSSNIERKVHFYRVEVENTNESSRPMTFDPEAILRHIQALGPGRQARCIPDKPGLDLFCMVDLLSTSTQRIRLVSSRFLGLPPVEEGGNIIGTLNLGSTQNLAEITHAVFFPSGIVGVEFNPQGPRIQSLRRFLSKKLSNSQYPDIRLEALLRQDVVDQLQRLEDVRLFEVKISASYIESAKQADADFFSALEQQAEVSEAQEIAMVLTPEKFARNKTISSRFKDTALGVSRLPDSHEEVSKLKLKGLDPVTERPETLDLLNDKLIATKRMASHGRDRVVESESAYSCIEEAYSELEDELIGAYGAS